MFSLAQVIEDHARLNPSHPLLRVKLQDVRHVLREVDDDGNIAALARQRGSAASAKDGRSKFPGQGHRRQHIFHIAGKHNSKRDLAIIRTVGGVQGAAAVIKAHFATNVSAQCRS